MVYKIYTLFYILLFFGYSCNSPEIDQNYPAKNSEVTKENIKEQFISANKQLMRKEDDELDYYAKSHKMPFVRTASGIRYFVYKPSARGDSIRDSMQVTMFYTLKLLDGTLCYSSKTDGVKTF